MALSLEVPQAGPVVRSVHVNNYAAIQALLNGNLDATNLKAAAAILASQLAGYPADATKVLLGDGTWGAITRKLDEALFTANVSVTATTEATANLVVAGNSITYDGTEIEISFYAPSYTVNGNTVIVTLVLLDGSTVVGQIAQYFPQTAAGQAALHARAVLTPSAGAHQYKIAAFVNTGTGTVKAGTSGAGNLMGGFLRVTRGT